jgi:hypothetical protein
MGNKPSKKYDVTQSNTLAPTTNGYGSAKSYGYSSYLPKVEIVEELDPHPENFKIVMIIDESGSMDVIRDDIIGSVNSFVSGQQKEKGTVPTTFTLIKFNNSVKTIINNKELSDVKKLEREDYVPGGGTALFDAIGNTIKKWNKVKNVLMVIVTDGQENSSKYYSKDEINEMIKDKKTNNGWTYVYLSNDLSVAEQGNEIGLCTSGYVTNATIKRECMADYIMHDLNDATTSYRAGKSSVQKVLNKN